VAKNKRRYQEIYLTIYKIPTKQSTTHEESGRISSIRNIKRTIARNLLDYFQNQIKKML